ncbi:MAG: NADH-quinone oxidoreductase subunit NuoE [Spirochaetia bacterium]|nr:NADH-quinone oxidoreductase subunit NuoE [Spirochaetia bacterium]MBQ3648226.1 NADH-quinone oxidoreductase subunit NuoE [Spirochaetia bacterium]MBQ3713136.1 NADH-quinone oxidoreductase subunit NuoE [Spirochaetia bacterium]MBQ6673704.1 NADH-quinone oxidoreductase subunit NuoE [Spirochaetia bacterium]MBQ6904694.1 NADH-quinone oxidoreductase subunit NuoE [Spirochaetia bacterium]
MEDKCCCNGNLTEAKEVVAEIGGTKDRIIPLLQEIQRRRGYLAEDLVNAVAEVTGIKPAEFFSVGTFYSQFRFTPLGKNIVKMCKGTACFVAGADPLIEAAESYLGIKSGQTTPDGLFTLEIVSCLGCCSLAPVVMINGKVYGKMTRTRLTQLLEEYRK